MLECPRFKPHYHVEVVAGAGVFVLSETEQTVLQGQLYEQVVPLLDGRPIEQVREQLAGRLTPARVYYTVNVLQKKGYLCEADEVAPAGQAALWSLQGLDPALVSRRLAETRVSVQGVGVPAQPLCALLEALDVRLSDDGDLRVVLVDHYLRKELREVNAAALREGKPWLLARAAGAEVWVGPLFRPGQTGCWECLAQRMRANFPVVGYLENLRAEEGLPPLVRGGSPAGQAVALGLAASAVASWIARGGRAEMLEGKLQTLDLDGWEMRTHHLLRQRACPACGHSNGHVEEMFSPLRLEGCKKTWTEDGGHRAHAPQETLDRYLHTVSPICGAVTRLERVTPAGAAEMHVYVSGHNIARGPSNLFNLKVDLRNASCGKGTTDLQARASALCEGLERYSGNFQGTEPRRRARFGDLGPSAIHPNACMLFSDRQYRLRDETNRHGSIFHSVPQPFDPDALIEWSPVWSLTHECVRYLPTEFCYFDYPHDCGAHFCVGCSNGNAAGNTLEEAVLQGLFELVERDSVALWWYNRVRVPGVDLDGIDDPYLRRLKACLARHGRDLWVLDLTSDLKVPVYAAVSHRVGQTPEQIMFGFGAHLEPRIALLRAVTELNQMLAHLLEAGPDKLTDEDTLAWLTTATLAEHPYLLPRDGAVRSLADHPVEWTDDLKEDVERCRARLEAQGLEMLVLDQTRPEVGLPVVKVIVPGLRHFWTRFAPGRLYDVPVRLGWLAAPLAEGQLNEVPMFL